MAFFRCGMGSGKKYDDYKGKTVTAKAVSSDSANTYLTIPKEGIYDETSKICTPNSNLSKKKVVTASKYYSVNSGAEGYVSITVPSDCNKGTLIADLYSYNSKSGFTITITDTSGIKSKTQLLDCYNAGQSQSAVTSIWDCEFNPGKNITIYFKNPGYQLSNFKIMIAY